MRAVIQRVTHARVLVDGQVTGEIGRGLVVLLGIGKDDPPTAWVAMADKVAKLRIFDDENGKMNLALADVGGAVLAVSQFTLYGDTHGQRRPSFVGAASAEQGRAGYDDFVRALKALGVQVETGIFQARMAVELANDGPVTILIDSSKLF
ncbi:MAG TPA: D-aminoacyl-tRNA deacylase [Candidatus Aquilonibacter sp.]|nr:D-aminoacyl-tRNA deacylase [Candidatus Aquilonibacter sp.]